MQREHPLRWEEQEEELEVGSMDVGAHPEPAHVMCAGGAPGVGESDALTGSEEREEGELSAAPASDPPCPVSLAASSGAHACK